MQDCQKLMRGRNSETPANTVAHGRLLRIHLASCGARLRRSITSVGGENTIDRGMTAGALPARWRPCVDSGACWSIRQKPALGQRTGWPRPLVLAGSGASMADGSVRYGRAPTVIAQQRRHGSTTTAQSHRCNCDGSGREARTRSDIPTSAASPRTNRRWENAKRTPLPSSFGTRLSLWHDTRRGCLL